MKKLQKLNSNKLSKLGLQNVLGGQAEGTMEECFSHDTGVSDRYPCGDATYEVSYDGSWSNRLSYCPVRAKECPVALSSVGAQSSVIESSSTQSSMMRLMSFV
jgi:hypothetical protein